MSCVWQLPNKRIYDDDDDNDVLVCLIVKWVGWVSPYVGMTGWVGQSLPLYLSELISHYLPPRSLRSSNTNLLTRPAGITSNFSSRAFTVSAPSTWNSLPAHIRSIDTLYTFKRHQKFHLYQSALPSSHPVPVPQIRSHDFWRYINLYVGMYVHLCVTDITVFCHHTVVHEDNTRRNTASKSGGQT